MKKFAIGLGLGLLIWGQAESTEAEEYVSHFNIGGKCTVVVTEIIGDSSYTTDYTCEEYEPIARRKLAESEAALKEQRERWERQDKEQAERERNQRRESAKSAFTYLKIWPYIDIALDPDGEAKWYPDKRVKALNWLTEGKTVGSIRWLFKSNSKDLKDLGYSTASFMAFLDAAEARGLLEAQFDTWTYHPYIFCGKKSTVFVAHLVMNGTEPGSIITNDFGIGMDWSFQKLLVGQATKEPALPEADCDEHYD